MWINSHETKNQETNSGVCTLSGLLYLKSCSIKGGGGGLKKSSHCHTVALLAPFFEEFDIHDLRVRYVWFSLN